MTDQDISMKPTAKGHKFPKFSAKISESTFELFYLEQFILTQFAQKF